MKTPRQELIDLARETLDAVTEYMANGLPWGDRAEAVILAKLTQVEDAALEKAAQYHDDNAALLEEHSISPLDVRNATSQRRYAKQIRALKGDQ